MADEWAAFRAQPVPAKDDEWAAFRGASKPAPATPPAKSGPMADIAKSAGVGLGEGVLSMGGALGDVNELAGRGMAWGLGKVLGDHPSPEQQAALDTVRAGPLALLKPKTTADLKKPVEAVTGEFYEPQTTAGEYARTIGQFAPSAVIGGPGGALARTLDVVVPAVASETAGQLTEGTAAEPYARFAGGLSGNLATAGARAYSNADNAIAAQAARGVAPAEFDEAQRLSDTAQRIGVPLSGPEAVQEATRGATKLVDVQRTVEGSMSGGATTARFYADRPRQIGDATQEVLDAIFPAPANPSSLGPRAAVAADTAINDVRLGINNATAPVYRAAEGHMLDAADFEPIARDPAFQASLRRLRSDEVLGPTYEGQPDNSIAVVDAVTKDMRDRGIALSNASNPGFSSQTAGMYGSGASEARDIARTPARGGSQAYDDALTMQAQARRDNLEPLEQGPLGRIANAKTTQAAYNEILPEKPMAGGSNEIVDTIERLMARDADLPPALVRQKLADTYDQAGRRIATGENQSVGGRFANAVAGTPEQRVTLDDVLEAIGRPEARQQTNDLMDVLRATSQRRPMGSPTEPNRMLNESLDRVSIPLSLAAAPASAGGTVFREVRDRLRMGARDSAHARLADLFTAPDSVQQIRELAARGAGHPMLDALARQAMQSQTTAQ